MHVPKKWLGQLPSTCPSWVWLPLPFPFGELRANIQVTGAVLVRIPDSFIIIITFGACAERAGHVGSHQGHTEVERAELQNALHTKRWRRRHAERRCAERVKRATHVLHVPVTWIASRVREFNFLRFFSGCGVLLLFDQRILTLRRWGLPGGVAVARGVAVAAVDAAATLGPSPIWGSQTSPRKPPAPSWGNPAPPPRGWYGTAYCEGYRGTGGSRGGIACNIEYICRAVNTVFVPGAKTRDSTRNVWTARNKQGGCTGQSKGQCVSLA